MRVYERAGKETQRLTHLIIGWPPLSSKGMRGLISSLSSCFHQQFQAESAMGLTIVCAAQMYWQARGRVCLTAT